LGKRCSNPFSAGTIELTIVSVARLRAAESVISYLKDPRTGIKDGGFPRHVKAEHGCANDEDQIEILQGLGQVLRNRRKKSGEQPVILGKA
jgi:hypothetical protein